MRNSLADFEAEKHEEEHKKTIYPKITIPKIILIQDCSFLKIFSLYLSKNLVYYQGKLYISFDIVYE